MQHAYFFGYGSLVNRDTHSFASAHAARLGGWRRIWRQTDLRRAAYLTVIPDPACEIDGLIAEVPGADWHALDQREAAYERLRATHQVRHSLHHQPEIAVYAISDARHAKPGRAGPVLLSYLDVVVQGYLREFGEAGVQDFFDTTAGWDTPILDDRDAPLYPRHRRLTPDERNLTDAQLARLGLEARQT